MWRLEKFHDLLSASWQTRKAGGIIQSKSKGPRIRRAAGVSLILSLRAWTFLAVRWLRLCTSAAGGCAFHPWSGCKMWPHTHTKSSVSAAQVKKTNRALLCLFIPFRPSEDWMMPACTGKDKLLYQSIDSNGQSLPETPHRHTQKQCFTSYLGISAQSSCCIKLTIIRRNNIWIAGGCSFPRTDGKRWAERCGNASQTG